MKELSIESVLAELPKVNAARNYWLVRTQGGDYYEAFINGHYIAIGYDEISMENISNAHQNKEAGQDILADKIRDTYGENEVWPNYAASQLLKFAHEIKKGDIVLIPSYSSRVISFGEVLKTPVYINDSEENEDQCPYRKRKQVRWLRTISRDNLDPNLYKLMFSRHAISDGKEYGGYIDVILNSFFVKDDSAHLVLDVQTTDDIKAVDLFQLGSLALEMLDDFCKETQLPFHSKDFSVKVNLQSPGIIELSGIVIGGVLVLGLLLIGTAGGEFTIKYKELDISLKTKGILHAVMDFIERRETLEKQKLLQKHMKDLEIKNPEELIRMLEALNKK